MIQLSRLHYPVTTLGYGKRIGLWFQGCSIRCKGCVSVDTWEKDNDKNIALKELYPLLKQWISQADGITISGGEPFEQFETLKTLLSFIQQQKGDKDFSVLVYTGYSFEVVDKYLVALKDLMDALITEPFIAYSPQTKGLRGSDNQHLHIFSALGDKHFSDRHLIPMSTTQLDISQTDNTIWLAGVPVQGDMPKLVRRLRRKGHSGSLL